MKTLSHDIFELRHAEEAYFDAREEPEPLAWSPYVMIFPL